MDSDEKNRLRSENNTSVRLFVSVNSAIEGLCRFPEYQEV